jgi:starch phosphorylase
LLRDFARFTKIVNNKEFPVQIIWAGKPYPEDFASINIFNQIHWETVGFKNCTVLTGYELWLSGHLKRGSDVWLNNPRLYHEASGTSGMTAAMNGSVNFSIPDGWVPEFAKPGKNSFIIEPASDDLSQDERDKQEANALYEMLENEIIPMYYKQPAKWMKIVKAGMKDVVPFFDSGRMSQEYYERLYN